MRTARARILLWLPTILFCSWTLVYLTRQWQAERERALYGGRSIEEWIDQALHDGYYSCHWATFQDPEISAAGLKLIAIGPPAVPALVNRLRSLHISPFRYKLVALRQKLWPSWIPHRGSLGLPDDVSGDVAQINYILSTMGEAARPAIPAMLHSAEDLHLWASLDLLDDFARLGMVARGALPTLKKWAKNGSEDAVLAVKLIENGKTNWCSADLVDD